MREWANAARAQGCEMKYNVKRPQFVVYMSPALFVDRPTSVCEHSRF